MRSIKLRARLLGTGKLIYFDLFSLSTKDGVLYANALGIDADTIQLYTGLNDKNGKEGYHKDIADAKGYGSWVIEWDDNEGGFYLKSSLGYNRLPIRKLKEMKIIGNIHENPELAGGK